MPQKNFWKQLKYPIFALAPMANVTDAVFRKIISKYSAPAGFVSWTEFTSVEALCSQGREFALVDLKKIDDHRPAVAQIFGSKPEQFEKVAKEISQLGIFDGIDINMGCPDKSIEKSGAGAALIKNPKLAKEIILATKKGAGNLPVSVKTRLGYNKNEVESWTREIIDTKPAALIMHLRTRKEMSKVPADWSQIKIMRKIINELPEKDRPVLLGNGDVESLEQGRMLAKKYSADGVMIGRGVFGTPWLFNPNHSEVLKNFRTKTEMKLEVMLEHTKLYIDTFGPDRQTREIEAPELKEKDWLKNFDYMKKHYKAYCSGFDGAKELRIKLMDAETFHKIEEVTNSWIKTMLS